MFNIVTLNSCRFNQQPDLAKFDILKKFGKY